MIRVTAYFPKQELQFAIDQIEKYSPGQTVLRQKDELWAVYRADLSEKDLYWNKEKRKPLRRELNHEISD